jgi:6-phosphogluconolactonase
MVDLFIDQSRKTTDCGQPFCAAVSRRIPEVFFECLDSSSQDIPALRDRIHLFWADQCCEPCQGQARYPAAMRAFTDRVHLPARNAHEVCGGCRSCEFSASAYEQTIKRVVGRGTSGVPSFDLILLHMSADGSIASLFPDTYGFYESQRLVWVSRLIGAGLTYITLTHPLLHAAKRIAVSVSGLESAVTLRDVFVAEPDAVRYPVHALWPVLDRITWLIDEKAATFLPSPLESRGT